MEALFTLVRELARRATVTDVAASKWLVERHGLAPLAARAGAHVFRDGLARSALEWARMERDVEPLLATLAAERIQVLPLKGLSYARTLYEHVADRPMNDVDLMVRPDDETRAQRVLAALGFRLDAKPLLHHATTWIRDRQVVDLHTNIIGPGRARVDLDAVWTRATQHLDANDALVFHLVHLARNRLRTPLVHVIDAARLMARADLDIALARARAWGVASGVTLAHGFCSEILAGHSTKPAGWLGPSGEDVALLREPPLVRKLIFDLATAGSPRQLTARVASYANRFARSSR
ncbi:MAG TPA: nucleotidyltransferase family protein [Polyangiaceae bacterium]